MNPVASSDQCPEPMDSVSTGGDQSRVPDLCVIEHEPLTVCGIVLIRGPVAAVELPTPGRARHRGPYHQPHLLGTRPNVMAFPLGNWMRRPAAARSGTLLRGSQSRRAGRTWAPSGRRGESPADSVMRWLNVERQPVSADRVASGQAFAPDGAPHLDHAQDAGPVGLVEAHQPFERLAAREGILARARSPDVDSSFPIMRIPGATATAVADPRGLAVVAPTSSGGGTLPRSAISGIRWRRAATTSSSSTCSGTEWMTTDG